MPDTPTSHYDRAVALADQAVDVRDLAELHHKLVAEAHLALALHDREQAALARMEQTSEQTVAMLDQYRELREAVRALLAVPIPNRAGSWPDLSRLRELAR